MTEVWSYRSVFKLKLIRPSRPMPAEWRSCPTRGGGLRAAHQEQAEPGQTCNGVSGSMLRNDGSRYLAIVGASLAAIAVLGGTLTFTFHMGDLSGRNNAQAQGYAAAYPTDASRQIADCWAKSDRSAAQECVASAIQASREAQRSEAELGVQRQMSDWAFWALVVAIVMGFMTTAVTSLGTYLIFKQVKLSREAVEETGRATQAMLEANDIEKNAQRPWLKVTAAAKANISPPMEVNGLFQDFPGAIVLIINVTIENIGDKVCRYDAKIYPVIDPMYPEKSSNLSNSFNRTLMPGDSFTHMDKEISISFDSSPIYVITGFYEDTKETITPAFVIECKYFWDDKAGETTYTYAASAYKDSWAFSITPAQRNVPAFLFIQDGAIIE